MEADNYLVPDSAIADIDPKEVFNVNVGSLPSRGIMGHVDSGKTSLCKLMTKIASTAALDKNPQSQDRGITLDLGFSAFFSKMPADLRAKIEPRYKYLQYTLVDCPGHASLMKTIIGSASIIDMMLLIIDINKGIEIQTAECMILGELLGLKVIVALNKIDMIKDGREEKIQAKIEGLKKTFQKTKFSQNQKQITYFPVSAAEGVTDRTKVEGLMNTIVKETEISERKEDEPFFFMIDHCFSVKGKGTVVTGTVLQGKIKKGDEIELPEIGFRNKIKSMQMFRKDIDVIKRGDRAGILINQLDSAEFERGIATKPGYLKKSNVIVAKLDKVRYWKHEISSKTKYHITVGHLTIMARLFLFQVPGNTFEFGKAYPYVEEVAATAKEVENDIYGILFLDKPCYLREQSFFIGSRLELSIDSKECRMAFCGTTLHLRLHNEAEDFGEIRLTKMKRKNGEIERVANDNSLIVKDLFTKNSNIQKYINHPLVLDSKPEVKAKILTTFGNIGKVKGSLASILAAEELEALVGTKVHIEYEKTIKMKV